MGKSYTPPFAIEYRDQQGWHRSAWEHRVHAPYRGPGRPNNAKAEQWRQKMNESFGPGGTNWHVSQAFGFVPHISSVRVYRQSTGETVARATMPMFEAV